MELVCTAAACPLLINVQSKEANLWEMIFFFEEPVIPVRKMVSLVLVPESVEEV